jgi:ParB family chromosome partitioning protein
MVSPEDRQQIEQRSQLRNVGLLKDEDDPSQGATFLPIEQIVTSSYQPRRYFDPSAMAALVASVKKDGILQPILVRPKEKTYEIVAGERRYRAAQEAGLRNIPVIIKSLSDEQAKEYALLENLQREDLNPVEETEGILQLLSVTLGLPTTEVRSLINQQSNRKKDPTDNFVRNPEIQKMEAVFGTLGRMSIESFRVHRLPLLKLPTDILDVLRQGKIEYTKAKEIAKLKDEDAREELLTEAIAEGLSLNQIKERLAKLKSQPEPETPKVKIRQVSQRLSQQKLWETDKSKWKKIEGWLNKIDALLAEAENDASASVNPDPDLSDGNASDSDPSTTPD